MKNQLDILTVSVGLLIKARPLYSPNDLLKEIKKESERLKVLFHDSFNHVSDPFVVKEAMYTRYTTLVSLSNKLWAMPKNFYHRAALMEMIGLIDYMEQHYGYYLKGNYAIPNFERFTFNNQISAKLAKTKRLLLSKDISEELVQKVIKAVDDLFNTGNHPVFSRADQQYLKAFLPRLHALALDGRKKAWDIRMRLLLVQWNFNHMGVYRMLAEEQHRRSLASRNYEKQHQYLYNQYFWLEEIQPESTSGYNVKALDLKSMLIKQVKSLQTHFTEVVQLKQMEGQRKLALDLNVEELAIEFKYSYDEGVFDYLHKKDAAEALSAHVKTKGTDDVSERHLVKFDKTRLYRSAVTVYHRHIRIVEQLARDFGIGLKG